MLTVYHSRPAALSRTGDNQDKNSVRLAPWGPVTPPLPLLACHSDALAAGGMLQEPAPRMVTT